MTLHGFYTNAGHALAAKIAAGTAEMTVTRAVAGAGHTADIPSATDLPEQKQTLSVGLPAVSGSTATLPVTLLESEATASYSLTELGVYAQDDGNEILFQVYQLDEAAAVTASGENVLRFYLRQSIGAAGVSVTCSPAGVVLEEDIAVLRARDAFADHRNLLDNPWFTVNQRGVSSWSLSDVYGVDRWKTMGIATVTVQEDGALKLETSDDNIVLALWQDFEVALLPGVYTVSVRYRNKVGNWYILYDGVPFPESERGLFSYTLSNAGGLNNFYIWSPPDSEETRCIVIESVKLERGAVSTLANDTAPNYAEELAKCQRYFQLFKTQSLRKTDKDDFRPTMRVNPAASTITIGGTTYYAASAET